MRFLSVVGTRPQLIKLKPIVESFKIQGLNHEYIDTGQHYDSSLNESIVQDLELPDALVNLGVRESTQSSQISKMLTKIDALVKDIKPDWVLTYGDTNSTLAATLASVKLGIRVAHIESGLRSGNLKMSEEQNRKMVDHVSNLLLAPTRSATKNLFQEGLGPRTKFVGDVMYDLVKIYEAKFSNFKFVESNYAVLTIHRAENVDNPVRLNQLFESLGKCSIQIVLFAHPRLLKRLQEFQINPPRNIDVTTPIPHSQMYVAIKSSKCVITDSGGLQKEAFLIGVPCLTIRHETEWPETLKEGWNQLVDNLSELPTSLSAIKTFSKRKIRDTSDFGQGNASLKIVESLLNFF